MLDSKNYSALEILHQNESFIYEEFATESIDNIHVQSVDLKTPLASILRVALSDIISSQILASKKDPNSESSKFTLRIYPDALFIVDKNSKKFSSIVLNEQNCAVREYLLQDYQNPEVKANEFRELLFNSDLLTKCAKNYKFKDRNYLFKKSQVKKELGNVLLEKKCFSNHYSNIKFEVSVKSKNKISYKVYVFYDVFKKDNDQFKLDETIKDDFINHFLKKIFVLAISTKRNKEFYRRIKSTTLKSSLAAVMSRNMSHNIGSHVLNKLSSAAAINSFFSLEGNKRFVRAVETIDYKNWTNTDDKDNSLVALSDAPDFKFSDETLTKEDQSKRTYVTFSPNEKNSSNFKPIYKLSPYFVDVNNNTTKEELARVFNDYLKKRMDFVADVATSNKALLNSNKYLFADIFRGFERNLLLLHNISGKEDKFSYQFDFQYCDGSLDKKGNPNVSNYYQYQKKKENGTLTLDLDDEGVPKKNNNFIDPIVAVPNDVLGSQAFYIILENIIRNTAKHSGSGNVIFTIKVEDLKKDDFYRVTVYDNVSFNADEADIKKYKNNIIDFDDLKSDDQKNAIKAYKLKKLVVDRNISIAQDVLDENNEIRTAGWGTIEIKLAACYLSGLDMLEMDNKMYWPIGYPAFAKAKQTVAKKEEPTPDEEKINEKAKEAYIKYLTLGEKLEEENKKFEIPVEGSKGFVTAKDCPDSLKRTILKKGKDEQTNSKDNDQGNGFTRYPIVQAVDGSKDETSGFGYSFLMKKPMKLLILDEENSLQYFDDEKYAELTALKRLGIDIIKTPKSDSIYNHQFMIIVGDKNSRHYGDWFNLPQERFVYDNNSFSLTYLKSYREEVDIEGSKFKFQYSYSKSDGNIISLNHSLPALLNNLDEIHLIYKALYKTFYNNIKLTLFPQIIDYNEDNKLLDELGLTFTHWLDDLVSEDIIDDLEPAKFDHHGSQKQEEFESDNNLYSEIFGSVSPIGLFLEGKRDAIRKLINNDSFNSLDSLKLDTQYFFTKGVNSKVMVIDERIQNSLNDIGAVVEASKNRITGYSLKNDILFKKANILVPQAREQNKNLNLNESSLHSIKENLYQYIRSNSENLEYFVIHFGVLESLRGNSEDTIISILNEVEKSILDNNCKLVITSGRGHTPDIKSMKRYFVAYSTISNLLLDPNSRSKSHLIECLNQLRIKTI